MDFGDICQKQFDISSPKPAGGEQPADGSKTGLLEKCNDMRLLALAFGPIKVSFGVLVQFVAGITRAHIV